MLGLGALCGMNVYCWVINSDMKIAVVMLAISAIMTIAWLMTLIFVFPLQARFENTIGATIQNAFLLAISHLPFTIAVMLLFAGLAYVSYLSWLIALILVFFGIGVVGYLLVYNFERLFKKCGYIEEDDGRVKNDDYEFDVEVDYDSLYNREESDAESEQENPEESEQPMDKE